MLLGMPKDCVHNVIVTLWCTGGHSALSTYDIVRISYQQ